jgi:hypothetical protein
MDFVTEYWHQIIFFLGAVVVAVRLQSDVNSNKRELRQLQNELDRRDTYVETVKQRAELDIHGKQISTLWEFVNKLRDKMNGGPL